MINQILSIVFLTIPYMVQGLAMDELLSAENAKSSKMIRALAFTFMVLPGIFFRVIVNNHEKTHMITLIHGLLIYFVQFKLFYKDPFWKEVMVMIAMFFGMSLSEIGLVFTIPKSGMMVTGQWDHTSIQIVIILAWGMILSIIGILITTAIGKRIIYRGKKLNNIGLFLLFALSQLFAFQTIFIMGEGGKMNYAIYFSVLVSALCSLGVLFIIFNQSEKEKTEQAYQYANYRRDAEYTHYQEITEKRQELEKIVSDNNEMLEKVEILIRENNKEEAENEIMHFLHRLDSTREYPYCSIPIINVILAEKKKECEKNQIDLNLEIHIFQDLNIKQVDLCSAFSNILDNAMKANKQIQDGNEKSIDLRATVVGEYFVIKCENTYQKSNGRFAEGSGYGLKILKDIAKRYHGNFQTKKDDERFYTQLFFMVEKNT